MNRVVPFPLRVLYLVIGATFVTCIFMVSYNVKNLQKDPNLSKNSEPFHPYTDFSLRNHLTTNQEYWDSLRPSFTCPPSLLQKVGRSPNPDARKWTCGLTNLGHSKNCRVYSFGVQHDSFFEAEVLETTSCEVYAYDPTVDQIGTPLDSKNQRVHFQKLGISGANRGLLKTLKTLMELNGGHNWIDILKMDVQWSEFSALENIMKDFPGNETESGLPFGQLLVEVHAWKEYSGQKVVDFLTDLERQGLRLFHKEFNPRCPKYCCELSFINVKATVLSKFLFANASNS